MRDVNFSRKYPSQVHLTAGMHEFTFTVIKESMYLGSIYLAPLMAFPIISSIWQCTLYLIPVVY